MEYRINGFEQIKLFYSWVFNNQDKNINATHISLYLFLINQNNRANWVEWFKCPYDLGMAGSCIGSRNTYYKVLDELKNWKLIDYKKGVNNYKAPMVKIYLLKSEQLTEQVPIPLCEPLIEQLTDPLTEHIYKLITNNIKLITNNYDKFEKFILNDLKKESKENKFVIPTILEIKNYCIERKNSVDAEKFFNFYESKGWMVGKNKMKDWKACVRTWESKENNQQTKISPQDSRINHLQNLLKDE